MAARKHRKLALTEAQLAARDDARAARAQRDAWEAGVMVGQRKARAFPVALGRSHLAFPFIPAFGAQGAAWEPQGAASGAVPQAGRRLCWLRPAAAPAGPALTVTAESRWPCVHFVSEDGQLDGFVRTLALPDGARRHSVLSALHRTVPWHKDGHTYAPPAEALGALPALGRFVGDLAPAAGAAFAPAAGGPYARLLKSFLRDRPVRLWHTGPTARTTLAKLGPGHGEVSRPDYHFEARAYTGSSPAAFAPRLRWLVRGMPDAVFAQGAFDGSVDECLLTAAVAVVLVQSEGGGATSDSRGATLTVLLTGILLEAAREALRRELEASGRPIPPGLVLPVMVVALLADWATLLAHDDVAALCRCWVFRWVQLGPDIEYSRSTALTFRRALAYIAAHLGV